jgi:two-component system, LytTR family, response regulator LytT
MKILIAEDEAIIAESLYQVLTDLGYSPIEPCIDKEEANNTIALTKPNLALVDIHIGEQFSGFEVAKNLNKNNIPFIFVTALYDKETVERAKAFNPSAYLVKPFNKENLFVTIEMALANYSTKDYGQNTLPDSLILKDGHIEIIIAPSDITHVEAAGSYINIFLVNGKKHLIKLTLQEILTQLQNATFVQIHKSFIINLHYLKAIKYDEILINDTAIPIGRAFRNNFKEKLNG